MQEEPKKSSGWKIILIILLVLAILAGLYFGLAWVLKKVNPSSSSSNVTRETVNGIDPALIGSWDTGCLVPDPGSPWAEKHTFTINADGTAEHIRYSGDSCAAIKSDQDDKINFTVPSTGKINLSFTTGVAAGQTIYDIYQVDGSNLEFGHGFTNSTKLCSASGGGTEADRFTCLNDFLVYKKQ